MGIALTMIFQIAKLCAQIVMLRRHEKGVKPMQKSNATKYDKID